MVDLWLTVEISLDAGGFQRQAKMIKSVKGSRAWGCLDFLVRYLGCSEL